jgi:hypothetical protein
MAASASRVSAADGRCSAPSGVLNEQRKQVALELNVEPVATDIISLHPAVLAR